LLNFLFISHVTTGIRTLTE